MTRRARRLTRQQKFRVFVVICVALIVLDVWLYFARPFDHDPYRTDGRPPAVGPARTTSTSP